MRRFLAFALFAAVVCGFVSGVWADEPTTKAFLRLAVGQHTARINRISIDAQERIAVTASHDKTLKVWNAVDGALIATLRVPIDDGTEGALYAVAVSPDGRTALAAGNTGSTWDGSVCLYLFDLEKRALKARLPRLPAVVNDIAYSADGRFVALGLGGTAGISVWDSTTFRLIASDADYRGLVASVAFDSSGRLASVSTDGQLRLYAPQTFARTTKVALKGGSTPTAVSFSPDGSRIAVGYADKRIIDVLSGDGKKTIDAPSFVGIDKGTPATLTWVAGRGGRPDLVAAGTLTDRQGRFIARRWSVDGVEDIAVANDTVTDLTPLAGGGYLYASADPSWGRVGSGVVTYNVDRVTADFRDDGDGRFAVSPNGRTVLFEPERSGAKLYRFNVIERDLAEIAGFDNADQLGDRVSLADRPVLEAAGLKITDWKNSREPKLNGKRLTFDDVAEVSRSAAILPDLSRVVIGAEFTLRLYDRNAMLIRQVKLPGPAWAVATPRDAPFVVAALGDGSIRWYNTGLGRDLLEEVMAFFPHRDGRRWALWTPEGFFDYALTGGADFVGFHLNEGKKDTSWMEFARAYRVFYASDLVTAKLDPANDAMVRQRLGEIGDVRQVIGRRPKVRLAEYCVGAGAADGGLEASCSAIETGGNRSVATYDLPAGSQQVVLRFAVRAEEGFGAVQVFRNGRNATDVRASRGLSLGSGAAEPTEQIRDSTIRLDPGENLVDVRVFDKDGKTYQSSQLLRLVVAKPAEPEPVAERKPRMLILSAGINGYSSQIGALTYAQTDARGFVRQILHDLPPVYDRAGSEQELIELYDERATKDAIRNGLATLKAHAHKGDLVIAYLSGHGVSLPVAPGSPIESYFFVTVDVKEATEDAVRTHGLSGGELVETLANMEARDLLLVLDTCQAGRFAESDMRKLGTEIGKPNIWAASTSKQAALDGYPGTGKGLFFYTISRGLESGARATEDHIVHHSDLSAYLRTEVASLAKKLGHAQKAVIFDADGEDYDPLPLTFRK